MQKKLYFPTVTTKASPVSQQPLHTIHSDTHLCLSHALPLIRERWKEGETRWCLWCSWGSLQNPCFLHFNNWALCCRPHRNLLLQSTRYFDIDMKSHLELQVRMLFSNCLQLSPEVLKSLGNMPSNSSRQLCPNVFIKFLAEVGPIAA